MHSCLPVSAMVTTTMIIYHLSPPFGRGTVLCVLSSYVRLTESSHTRIPQSGIVETFFYLTLASGSLWKNSKKYICILYVTKLSRDQTTTTPHKSLCGPKIAGPGSDLPGGRSLVLKIFQNQTRMSLCVHEMLTTREMLRSGSGPETLAITQQQLVFTRAP